MFGKKKCKNCNSRISDKFDFCPYCGKRADLQGDFGMLGKNDLSDEFDVFSKSMFGGFGGGMLNKMFGNAMRMLEKEMKKEMESPSFQPTTNFQLFINGRKINLGGAPMKVQKKETKKIPNVKLPQNKLKNFAKLPRENPKTDIRRLSNKIVYEINVPGVKSVDDVSITVLENSTEIKAVSKEKAYMKVIAINLPIVDYKLEDEKIILEMEARG